MLNGQNSAYQLSVSGLPGSGLGVLLWGSLVAAGLTTAILWSADLSWLWALLMYPVFGVLFTGIFAVRLLMSKRVEAALPRSRPMHFGSPERTPPR